MSHNGQLLIVIGQYPSGSQRDDKISDQMEILALVQLTGNQIFK